MIKEILIKINDDGGEESLRYEDSLKLKKSIKKNDCYEIDLTSVKDGILQSVDLMNVIYDIVNSVADDIKQDLRKEFRKEFRTRKPYSRD